ncbi:uncharacterized protein TNCV_497591 [Trichonephila clavipes]|nr:uncharacterized protein TNCV_497591 [Trichonephila clavipes]
MRKICVKVVAKVLSDNQKQRRKDVCVDMLEHIANERNLLESVVTCDETWSFAYNPESKKGQSIEWKFLGSPRPQKVHPCQNQNSRADETRLCKPDIDRMCDLSSKIAACEVIVLNAFIDILKSIMLLLTNTNLEIY